MKHFEILSKITTMLAIALWLGGCAVIVDHPHKRRDTSLSRAATTGSAGRVVSRKENVPPLPVFYAPSADYSTNDSGNEPVHDMEPADDYNQSAERINETESNNDGSAGSSTIHFSILKEVSGFDYLENTKNYSLAVEGRGDKTAFAVRVSGANMDFRDDWEFATRLDDPWSLDLGVEGKIYFAEKKHFLQPYVGLSLAYGALFWSYRSSLLDPETGEIIKKDHADYIKIGAMAGIFVRLAKDLRIGAEIRPVLLLPGTTTHQGFINDIIDDTNGTYAGVTVSLGY